MMLSLAQGMMLSLAEVFFSRASDDVVHFFLTPPTTSCTFCLALGVCRSISISLSVAFISVRGLCTFLLYSYASDNVAHFFFF